MSNSLSRRLFLRYIAKLGAFGAAAPIMVNLASINAAAEERTEKDYKALVCIYLFGGNDAYNTVIPYDLESHLHYANARKALAIPRALLRPTVISPENSNEERKIALHPNLKSLKELFDQNQLAVAMNLGALNQPTSKAQYRSGENLPRNIMSHQDPSLFFNETYTRRGRNKHETWLYDLLCSQKSHENIIKDRLNTQGHLKNKQAFQPGNLFHSPIRATHASIQTNLKSDSQAALDIPKSTTRPTSIQIQLSNVLKMISMRKKLDMRHQVFFVSLGGFDSHYSLNSEHPRLLKTLGDAMSDFQNSLNNMNLGTRVTTFTASDFGRALKTNGYGSEHGWGGHHFIMGGAIKNKTSVGSFPSMVKGGDDDIGDGRLLPSIAQDQFMSTLALWMGVPISELSGLIPNIGEYETNDLGFLNPTV